MCVFCFITGLDFLVDLNLCNTVQLSVAFSWIYNQTQVLEFNYFQWKQHLGRLNIMLHLSYKQKRMNKNFAIVSVYCCYVQHCHLAIFWNITYFTSINRNIFLTLLKPQNLKKSSLTGTEWTCLNSVKKNKLFLKIKVQWRSSTVMYW